MSAAAAAAFMDRLETDPAFMEEIKSLNNDPAAVYAAVQGAGFDATIAEVQAVFLARYGSELSMEQLDVIAGGVGSNDIWNVGQWDSTMVIATGSAVAGGVIFAAAAAAAIG